MGNILKECPICRKIGLERSLFIGKLGLCTPSTVFLSFASACLISRSYSVVTCIHFQTYPSRLFFENAGHLTVVTLRNVFEALEGTKMSDEQLQRLIYEVDLDMSSTIDLHEFLKVCALYVHIAF